MDVTQEDLDRIKARLESNDEYNHLIVGTKQVIIIGSDYELADLEMPADMIVITLRPK